jgi:hypothetical protein
MKHNLMAYDSMPWTRKIKNRRHADIPGFLKKISSGVKNLVELRTIGNNIVTAAKRLNAFIKESDKIGVKVQLAALRVELRKLESLYREIESE